MNNDPRKKIFVLAGILFGVLVLVFVYSRYKPYFDGARLKNLSLQNNQVIDTNFHLLRGNAQKVKTLYINGDSVEIDVSGFFEKNLVIPSEYSIIDIVFIDSFGRTKTQKISVFNTVQTEVSPIRRDLADIYLSKELIQEEELTQEIN